MTTINQEEIQKFSKLAEEWWDVSGKFKPLHMFNPVRIEYILEKTSGHFNRTDKRLPLKGLKSLVLIQFGRTFILSVLVLNWDIIFFLSISDET